MARVTSADVAREAGLSRATVSYVLNADPRQRIPDATRQRVLDAAARLDYTPYGPARLLRGAASRTVLLHTPSLQSLAQPVGAAIVETLADALTAHGLQLLWQLGSPAAAVGGDVAPALVLTSLGEHESSFAELAALFRVPVRSIFPGLDAFQASPARAQVDHLVDRGHRHLAYAASDDPRLERSSTLRRDAMVERALQAGLPLPRQFAMPVQRESARATLASVLALHPAVTAVCAYNDRVGMALLAAAADLGVAVPGRLAVIGVDDDPVSQLTTPALSSVRAELDGFIDDFAAEIALTVADGERGGVRLPALPAVVARDST